MEAGGKEWFQLEETEQVTDFLRENLPKLLQTAPVLPAVNFGIWAQSNGLGPNHSSVLRKSSPGVLLSRPHLNNGELGHTQLAP
jgi:hypothetical protein